MKAMSFRFRLLSIAVFTMFASMAFAAGDATAGKALFMNNCATCHAKDMKTKLTGPALAGVEGRWNDQAKLYAWIRNSQAFLKTGDAYANKLYNEYGQAQMSAFTSLKDADIDNILAYINKVAAGGGDDKKGATTSVDATDASEDNSSALWYGLAFFILGGLALLLSRIINNLNRTASERVGNEYHEKTWKEKLTSKGVIGFVTFALIVLGGYTTVNNAIALGRQQNYAPEQPIKFSHKTHAGLNKIDCQYCHDGARRSKHGIIPATNTCMNCHKAIKVGSQYGTAELTKIYVSSGFDPSTDKYIENYENLSEQEVAAIYKKWIAAQFRESRKIDAASNSSDVTIFAEEQWSDIASSLKTEYKDKVQGPIQWKRIHNLPDHVYFNHAQHVTVGQVECQKCHGPVEKMAVLKQHAPLSMGWCVNCHRETEVKFKDNDFYKNYERYHKEMASGKRKKVTVEDIGGLECQKCHY